MNCVYDDALKIGKFISRRVIFSAFFFLQRDVELANKSNPRQHKQIKRPLHTARAAGSRVALLKRCHRLLSTKMTKTMPGLIANLCHHLLMSHGDDMSEREWQSVLTRFQVIKAHKCLITLFDTH